MHLKVKIELLKQKLQELELVMLKLKLEVKLGLVKLEKHFKVTNLKKVNVNDNVARSN